MSGRGVSIDCVHRLGYEAVSANRWVQYESSPIRCSRCHRMGLSGESESAGRTRWDYDGEAIHRLLDFPS